MATVYLAHDPRFERDVALKAIAVGYMNDPTFRTRFEREAKTIATLEHPAIVPVYDFGEDNDQLYLVMRYMPGGTLSDRIVMRTFQAEQAIPIIRRIADALDHAHQHGVVHRDLKPGNILFDEYERAYLSDFGIVKVAAEETGADLTGSGVVGTPAYMSPEQIHGDEVIDGRSDIYTLGIILFEMLTGRKPYRADTPVKQMMAHVMDPIPDIRSYLPDFPSDGVPIIEKVLAKAPSARYQRAQELTADLTATLTGHQFAPLPRPPLINVDHDADTVPQDLPTIVNPAATLPQDESRTGTSPPTPTAKNKRPSWLLFGGMAIIVLGILLFFALSNRSQTAVEDQSTPLPTEDGIVADPPEEDEPLPEPTDAGEETAVAPSPTSENQPTESIPPGFVGELGLSVMNNAIPLQRLGVGEQALLLVGGLHAGQAPASVAVVDRLYEHYLADESRIPADVTLFFVPSLNPDSILDGSRLNANGVDLNRNWGCDWSPNVTQQSVLLRGVGGEVPFSEPEVVQLRQFIEAQNSKAASFQVILFDAPIRTGWVSAGGCGTSSNEAQQFERLFGGASGFLFGDVSVVTAVSQSGSAADWLDGQGIPSITVWLPDRESVSFSPILDGVEAIVGHISNE